MSETGHIALRRVCEITPTHPSLTTVWRWTREGIGIRGGRRVRLQTERVGGRIYTTRDWLHEFHRALQAEGDAVLESRRAMRVQKRIDEGHVDHQTAEFLCREAGL